MTAPVAAQRKGKLLIVSGVTGHGGPNATLRAVVPRLDGFERLLVGPYAPAEAAEWVRAGVAVETMPRPRGFVALARALARLLGIAWRERRGRPLLFANGLTEAALVAPVALIFRLPLFVWIHNYAPPRIAVALAPLLRRLPGERVAFAAVSRMAAAVGREVLGDVPVAVLPNPIDDAFWTVERAPIGARRLRVSYLAGTDRRYKGFDLLPRIVAGCDDLGIDWLIVAAEATQPEAWSALRATARELASSTVEVRGRTETIRELYERSDVVLVPSRQESFCRVAAEAMATGAAVLSSRLEAIEEVCGDVAFYFPAEDPAAAAAALRRVAGSRDRLAEVGARGRARARSFTVETVVGRLERLLGELVGR